MIKRARIFVLLLGALTGLLTQGALSQESISVSRAAWVKAAGNDIYDAGTIGAAQIHRWRDRSMSTITPFRPAPGESLSLLATYGAISGDFYICYSTSPRAVSPRAYIAKLDYEKNSMHQVWGDDQLFPRSIAVGPTGYIYVLGLTRKEERELFFPIREDAAIQVDLLHIFTGDGREVRSMIPISISAQNPEAALSILRPSTVLFRKNGNFFVQFNPFTTRHKGWESLAKKDVIEYSPEGQIINTRGIAAAPTRSNIAALVVDTDDSLIVQFVDFSASEKNKQGITTFGWNEAKVFRLPPAGENPQVIMKDLARYEIIAGILANGKIMTELFGQNTVRIWGR